MKTGKLAVFTHSRDGLSPSINLALDHSGRQIRKVCFYPNGISPEGDGQWEMVEVPQIYSRADWAEEMAVKVFSQAFLDEEFTVWVDFGWLREIDPWAIIDDMVAASACISAPKSSLNTYSRFSLNNNKDKALLRLEADLMREGIPDEKMIDSSIVARRNCKDTWLIEREWLVSSTKYKGEMPNESFSIAIKRSNLADKFKSVKNERLNKENSA